MKRLGVWTVDDKYPIELCQIEEGERDFPHVYLIKYNDVDHKMYNVIEPQENLYWVAHDPTVATPWNKK